MCAVRDDVRVKKLLATRVGVCDYPSANMYESVMCEGGDYMYICIYVFIYIYICMYLYIYTYICVCKNIFVSHVWSFDYLGAKAP